MRHISTSIRTGTLCLLVAAAAPLLWGQQALAQAPADPNLVTAAQQFTASQPPLPPPGESLGPNELDDLVAPIALYPDPLLSQILVASTYPLEIVQASQWIDRNPGVTGTAVLQAAQQQNWDPSIQALLVFPDVVKRLTQDVTWTTNLGNAFLSQESDVMAAVQRMRLKAQEAGKLNSNEQQTVTVTTPQASAQPMIQIAPANPQIVYVPTYDPYLIWGPPVYYPYAYWQYPRFGSGIYFNFGPAISIGNYFGAGWGGWNSWGWSPAWGTGTIIVNNSFFHRYNFNAGRSISGFGPWTHNVIHRRGVPYADPGLSARFGASVRQNLQPRPGGFGPQRGSERLGDRQIGPSEPGANGNVFGGVTQGGAVRRQSDHGFGSLGPARSGATRGGVGGAAGGGRTGIGNRRGGR